MRTLCLALLLTLLVPGVFAQGAPPPASAAATTIALPAPKTDGTFSLEKALHEEQPLCCESCGKPFATRSMLDVLEKKLAGHWMFQTEEARRRLQMCEDCRVRDLFTAPDRNGPG